MSSTDEAMRRDTMENWNETPGHPVMVSFGSRDTQEVSIQVASKMLTYLREHNQPVFSAALVWGLADIDPVDQVSRVRKSRGGQA
jgi:hypothetical protein